LQLELVLYRVYIDDSILAISF